MKKVLLSTLTLLCLSLFSQAQIKVGVVAGGQLSQQRINVKESSIYAGEKLKSFSTGLTADIRLSQHFYLQPQVLYSRKGSTILSSKGEAPTKVKINYAELPVIIVYKIDLPFGKLFGGAGAAFGYGISGKLEQGGQTKKVYADSRDWKHTDLSMRLTAGFELNNGFFVSATTQKSLLNISTIPGASIKNRSLALSVGYLIDL